MGQRLASVDALRGAAALAVLAHHVKSDAFDRPEQPLAVRALGAVLVWGNLGVPLFFVLSGFCIHLQTLRRNDGARAPAFVPFWKRRLWRLYPPYFVVLCASMAIVVGAARLGKNVHLVTDYPAPHATWVALDFVAHATMTHGLIPMFDTKGGNPALWTLAREEYFYLLYFPLLLVNQRLGARGAVLAVLVLGVLSSFLLRPVVASHPAWESVLLASAFVLWIQWCLGMLAAEAYRGRVALPKWCSSAWAIPVAAVVAYAAPPYLVDLAPALWGLVFFVLVNGCVKHEREGRWRKRGLSGWLTRVGVMSYSLYLVHGPVCGVLRQALSGWVKSAGAPALVGSALAMALAGYGVAWAFFMLVERRFLRSPSSPA